MGLARVAGAGGPGPGAEPDHAVEQAGRVTARPATARPERRRPVPRRPRRRGTARSRGRAGDGRGGVRQGARRSRDLHHGVPPAHPRRAARGGGRTRAQDAGAQGGRRFCQPRAGAAADQAWRLQGRRDLFRAARRSHQLRNPAAVLRSLAEGRAEGFRRRARAPGDGPAAATTIPSCRPGARMPR